MKTQTKTLREVLEGSLEGIPRTVAIGPERKGQAINPEFTSVAVRTILDWAKTLPANAMTDGQFNDDGLKRVKEELDALGGWRNWEVRGALQRYERVPYENPPLSVQLIRQVAQMSQDLVDEKPFRHAPWYIVGGR